LTLEYGADYLKLVKTDPSFKYTVTEVDLKKIPANDEMSVTLYFEPLKSTQASLNVHMDYEAKGGQSSGVSTAVFERVDLYKEDASLNVSDLDNASKAEIVTDSAPVEVVEATVEDVEVMDEEIETIEMNADVVDIEEADIFDPIETEAEVVAVEADAEVVAVEAEAEVVDPGESGVDDILSKLDELGDSGDDSKDKPDVEEKTEESVVDPGESGVDDLLSKLDELDDPANAPKKKEKKSEDEEEDKSGMDDVLGKLDEL